MNEQDSPRKPMTWQQGFMQFLQSLSNQSELCSDTNDQVTNLKNAFDGLITQQHQMYKLIESYTSAITSHGEKIERMEEGILLLFRQVLAANMCKLCEDLKVMLGEGYDEIYPLLSDFMQGFGYDFYEPQTGIPFDSKFMTPHRTSAKGRPSELSVAQVIRPGVTRENRLVTPCIVVLAVNKAMPTAQPANVQRLEATA